MIGLVTHEFCTGGEFVSMHGGNVLYPVAVLPKSGWLIKGQVIDEKNFWGSP